MVQSISEAAKAALYSNEPNSETMVFNTEDYRAVVVEGNRKSPDVYVMLSDSNQHNFSDALKLAISFLNDPDGLVVEDIDALAYDIQVGGEDYPDTFADVQHLFDYSGVEYATFLSLRLNDYLS